MNRDWLLWVRRIVLVSVLLVTGLYFYGVSQWCGPNVGCHGDQSSQ